MSEILYTANINREKNGLYYLQLCNARQNNKEIWVTSKYKRKSSAFKAIFDMPIQMDKVVIIDNTN